MKKSKDEILTAIREIIGDNNSDEAIALIEDVTDSFTDEESEWKRKYEENDRNWRQRYMDRFMNPEPMPVTTPEKVIEDNTEDVKTELNDVTFDDLFEDREG